MTDGSYNGWTDDTDYTTTTSTASSGTTLTVDNTNMAYVQPVQQSFNCADCYSMKGEKVASEFIGFGFSFCEEHFKKFLDNQKKIVHDKMKEQNGES